MPKKSSLGGHTDSVRGVAFRPDGQTLGSGRTDDTIRLWDVKTGTELKKLTGHTSKVHSVVLSPDGKTLASCSGDNTIRLWDVSDFNTDTEPIEHVKSRKCRDLNLQHGGDVQCVAYSQWDAVLASGGTDKTMRLWRTSADEALSTYNHEGYVNSIAFSLNDVWIASGSDDGKLRLFNRYLPQS